MRGWVHAPAQNIEAVFEQRFEKRMAELLEQVDGEKAQARQEVQAAQEQVARMAESYKSLNEAFKQLKTDDNLVRVADLRMACSQLETKLRQRTEEVEALMPLKYHVEATEKGVRRVLWCGSVMVPLWFCCGSVVGARLKKHVLSCRADVLGLWGRVLTWCLIR